MSVIDVQPVREVFDAVPHPRNDKPEHSAHPDSPVGRTVTRIAATGPIDVLCTLQDRLEHTLLDLTRVTDAELHAITDLVLAEKHRRATRWFAQ